MSNKKYMTVPRFMTSKWTGAMGWVIALFCGALTALMIWSLPGEEKFHMVIITILAAIVFGLLTLLGLRLIVSPLDRVRFSEKGVQILLLGFIPVQRVPRERIRSVIGAIREYAHGLKEYQIYTLKINYETAKGKDRTVIIERTARADEAVNTYLPGVIVLL